MSKLKVDILNLSFKQVEELDSPPCDLLSDFDSTFISGDIKYHLRASRNIENLIWYRTSQFENNKFSLLFIEDEKVYFIHDIGNMGWTSLDHQKDAKTITHRTIECNLIYNFQKDVLESK